MLILNVDDDIDDREMFQAAIDEIDLDITCLQFESGIELLEFLAHNDMPADVLFIDINMPKMNGFECVQHIRQTHGDNHMQIVMYSTAFNPRQQDSFKDANIRYVTKTSRFSELVQTIKEEILHASMESVGTQKK